MAHGVHPIDPDLFAKACEKYLNGGETLYNAAKIAGLSIPTFKKYLFVMLSGGEFPDTLFKQ